MSGQKSILLRSSIKRGIGPFLLQLARSVRDSFWCKRHLMYVKDIRTVTPDDFRLDGNVSYRRIRHWNELKPEDIERLERDKEVIEWGDFDWLDEKKFGLIVAEIDGELAALKWWRHADQTEDFFIDVPENYELGWHAAVLPEYRGRKLIVAIVFACMEYRASEGIHYFYETCRDYNVTSRLTIARLGCNFIGHVDRMKWSGAVNWHPAKKIVPAKKLENMR